MPDPTADVVIAGASARALAESAALAGYAVVAVDGYGDLDLGMRVRAISLRRDLGLPYSATRAARAARGVPAAAAAYTSGFENHPAAIAALARGRTLWGNPPATVRQVRRPTALSRALGRHGFALPEVRVRHAPPSAADAARREWLIKPVQSGGGHGIRPWRAGAAPRHAYLQERIQGEPGSIVFVADGRRAVSLGLTRQLVGDAAFGAAPFRYSGSLLCGGPPLFPREAELMLATSRIADAVTATFHLVGLNGIDFIARDGVPWPIEVNPRFTASMELIERARGISMFALHAAACRGELPSADLFRRRLSGVWGKAIVYARSDVTMREIRRWWRDDGVRDVPWPGEEIARGRPICTLLASALEADACHRALIAHAAEVYSAATIARRSVA
ncbi:MAG TPA: ATP-grasp domain-containing protein [Gemmatimonadales bacterium]|nr:ATP-grasp domain-containing protein [Gemmatimonadales bacterium]